MKVYTEAIKPEDFGLWKISVADGEDKYGHKPVSFNLRVNAGGKLSDNVSNREYYTLQQITLFLSNSMIFSNKYFGKIS